MHNAYANHILGSMNPKNGPDSHDIALAARSIHKFFMSGKRKIEVLNNVSLEIVKGSFTIIFGPSGSGKSTLLNVLAGLEPPDTGQLIVNNQQNVYEVSKRQLTSFRAANIGFVHQDTDWIKSLNVLENVAMPLYCQGYGRREARALALQALERINMSEFAASSPVYLSGGEAQRISMARAIVNNPAFLILDEPTGNLDSHNGDEIIKLVLHYQREFSATVILVTHNMEYISLADHLIRIQDGLVEDIVQGDNVGIVAELMQATNDRIQFFSKAKSNA